MSSADISDRVSEGMGVITPNKPAWEEIKHQISHSSPEDRLAEHIMNTLCSEATDGYHKRQEPRTTWKKFERELNFFRTQV